MLLAVAMVFTMSSTAFASAPESNVSAPKASESGVAFEILVITDDGLFVNGTFISQAEFITLLNLAVEINAPASATPRIGGPRRSAAALIAGTYFIPGIGEVIITAYLTIIVAEKVIEVGSWLYNTIVEWFEQRAIQKAYDKAKEDGTPTDNHSTQSSKKGSLPTKGDPNSSKDLIDDNGVKQRRYYDKNGNADMDIDYWHPGENHKFPHRHDWTNGTRGLAY